MRDPQRIERVLRKLERFWRKHPDLRLGQLVSVLSASDVFQVEDDVLEQALDERLAGVLECPHGNYSRPLEGV